MRRLFLSFALLIPCVAMIAILILPSHAQPQPESSSSTFHVSTLERHCGPFRYAAETKRRQAAALHTATQDAVSSGNWRALFNGKDLSWKHVGPGEMTVEEGLIRTHRGMGLLYWTAGKVGDCRIRVVY